MNNAPFAESQRLNHYAQHYKRAAADTDGLVDLILDIVFT